MRTRACLGAIAALVLGATPVFAQPIWFTGNVEADFVGPGVFLVADPPGVDVGIPVQFPAGTISGHDMEDLRISYDAIHDTLYVGFNTYRIGGDVDGDGDPSRTSAALAQIGGSDRPHFGGTESFTLGIDVDEDGDYDVIVGVPGTTDINGFTVAEFEGSPFAPAFAFGDPLDRHIGAVYGSPTAAAPHVEFTILHFSELLGRNQFDASARFGVNAFMGSFADAGIGEDHTPGVARTVDICLTPNAPDICNDFDDDCDGDIDEDVVGKGDACIVGVGACRALGHRVCGEDGALICNAVPRAPTADICDGIDNDCDGAIDEAIAPVPSACGAGLCAATGNIICKNGKPVDTCRPAAPRPELCNEDDDDCDGRTDENIAPVAITCGRGICQANGQRRCVGGDLIDHCMPFDPEAEICDGLDNNCDGRIDDGLPPIATTCGVGTCAANGTATCRNGDYEDTCTPTAPKAEACDGDDDDCDGRTDEGMPDRQITCGIGACRSKGIERCEGGEYNDHCNPGTPALEACNGIDDDCDGRTDEGIAPVRTECGTGACANTGERTCQGGRLVDSCAPGAPRAEACNATDDDCDGRSDEGIAPVATACGTGACADTGERTCQGGRLVDSCDPGDPRAEVCNATDDDCDGRTDEGIAPVRTECGTGACADTGERTCQGGRLVDSCVPGAPGAEVCNAADDDCDGRSDEGIAPVASACGTGACAARGEITCRNGDLTDSCDPGDPRAEVCNATDDDCDGRTDERIAPVRTECGIGACADTGERSCQDGRLVDSCEASEPGVERCNAIDDDCDGTTDEGIAPVASACGAGACAARGEITCRDGDLVDSCDAGDPRAEVCNATDDDCDGRTDEGIAPVRTECGTGACADTGERTCREGRLVDSCDAGEPGREVCNGTDDDCDGRTDEAIAPVPSACGTGACAARGEITCRDGDLVDSCDAGDPIAEVCNATDDDCDGRTDEGIAPVRTECGTGACADTGERTCREGRLVDSCEIGMPGREECNGTDDDCDGRTDEAIAPVASACGTGACAARGEIVCRDGDLVDSCDAGDPRAEVCNATDDDCDGDTDEDIAPVRTECGTGACADTGERTCREGRLVDSCEIGMPGREECNGTDDDCDGNTDEAIAPVRTECGTGACADTGERTCQGGRLIDSCDAGDPVAEVCNATDDDCDGRTDEGIAPVRTECGTGACADTGERTCREGRLVDSCDAGEPGREVCNGTDDDCDGNTDEAIAPVASACGTGACAARGEITCRDGDLVDSCDAGDPVAEVCNATDDDCDGDTDEDIAPVRTECGTGACADTGERTCREGRLVDSCEIGMPGREECNGTDDDCDGNTDEGIAPVRTECGTGACADTGERTCQGGRLIDSCDAGDPVAEVCNATDDDCDGRTDEGIAPVRTECGTGACADTGERTCREGRLVDSCDAGEPGREVCNGTDDDCDGRTDEAIAPVPSACGTGACAARGEITCRDGDLVDSCDAGDPIAEVCNATDDDCDGRTDEGIAPVRTECGTGACADTGERTCREGRLVDSCDAGEPGREVCNGTDDDCDGRTDEAIAPVPSACGTGACAARGEITCRDGDLVDSCEAGDPIAEVCNATDDDCDGRTDEGIAPVRTECGTGACADTGERTCREGRLVDSCDAGEPGREVCNGTDDDCDGHTDEAIAPVHTECGTGACADTGERTCRDGRLVDSCEAGEPGREVCNGTDDDCDGAIDEDIAPEPTACGEGLCAARGQIICRDGDRVDTCQPGAPDAEQCNAQDDDCDGNIDEGIAAEPSECGEGTCAARGEIVCIDGEEIDTCLPDDPAEEICNEQDDDCDGDIDEGSALFAANEYAANGHAIVMGNFALAGNTVMHFADDARLTIDTDGTARLTGTAVIVGGPNPRGQQWTVNATFAYRGQGPAFGGPKIELPAVQTPEITDAWRYFDMVEGTLTRPGSVVTLTQAPADGRFPMQLGIAANGKDADLGMSLWFDWVRRDADGTGCDGHGDFNLDLAPIDVNGCVPADEVCDDIDNDLDGAIDEGFGVGEPCEVGEGRCAAEGTTVCGPDGNAVCDAVPGNPRREVCNGEDDDCDGASDEDTPVVPTICGVGACAAEGVISCSTRACTRGCLVDSCEPGEPSAETCNGIDDDCDGATDEGIAPVATACGVGACAARGELACQGGQLVDSCEPGAPAGEQCNAQDDDCDGDTDEGIAAVPTECGEGTCAARGEIVCVDGDVIDTCLPEVPEPETCNEHDDDCDGEIDEGTTTYAANEYAADGHAIYLLDFARPGATLMHFADDARVTIGNDGIARLTGTAFIVSGPNAHGEQWTVDATFVYRGQGPAFGGPKIELPDFQTPEVTDPWHYYDMTEGTLTRPGSVVTLRQSPPNGQFPMQIGISANGKDHDLGLSLWFDWIRRDADGTGCNGIGDFNIDIDPIDADGCLPEDELCDDLDNDLDGAVDEGFGLGDACEVGQGTCAAEGTIVCGPDGAPTCDAVPGRPGREICDGEDDDCDGTVDEDTPNVPVHCGVGACAAQGVISCIDGCLVEDCTPGEPVAETCNGTDDDCDGRTDEGIVPVASTCGEGICAARGVRSCEGGQIVDTCDAGEPGREVCNAIDDDCDGETDEDIAGFPTACGEGACASRGQTFCRDGALIDTCEPRAPGREVCNATDDDCDGATDEAIAPVPTACGQGACADRGEITCRDGRLVDSCQPGQPGREVCNATDDDCDGNADEGINPVPSACGQGACADRGEITCRDGRLVDSCEPGDPAREVCNAFDDDCDGDTDEDIEPTRTECGDGSCAGTGALVCVDGDEVDTCLPEPPGAEICNDLDDDCDGNIDEGFHLGERCQVGVGACLARGTLVCGRGDALCDAVPGAPRPETCDGTDEDCDGAIDELPPRASECGVGVCESSGDIACEHGVLVDTCEPGLPDDEVCNDLDDDCDGTIDEGTESRQWRVTEFAGGHALWLQGFNRDGHLVQMRLRPGATFLWHLDGNASLIGTAYIHHLGGGPGVLGQEWHTEFYLRYRGQGPEHGGPKIELPGVQTPAVTDLWNYWDIIGARIIRGDELVHFTQRPADGSFPFQFGHTANGKDHTLGGSLWFDWHRVDAHGRERRGLGDLNVTMHDETGVCAEVPIDQICVDHCEARGAEHMQGCLMLGYPRAQCEALLEVWFDQCVMFQCC